MILTSSHLCISSFLPVRANITKVTFRKLAISYYELDVGSRWWGPESRAGRQKHRKAKGHPGQAQPRSPDCRSPEDTLQTWVQTVIPRKTEVWTDVSLLWPGLLPWSHILSSWHSLFSRGTSTSQSFRHCGLCGDRQPSSLYLGSHSFVLVCS